MNAPWYLARAALHRTWRGAVALAIVIGVIGGRLVWGGVASSIGVAAGHVLPWRQLFLAAFGALAVGLAASWWPSRFVRRGRAAEVLRAG